MRAFVLFAFLIVIALSSGCGKAKYVETKVETLSIFDNGEYNSCGRWSAAYRVMGTNKVISERSNSLPPPVGTIFIKTITE